MSAFTTQPPARGEGTARDRSAPSLVGANTVNGPAPDRAVARLACGQGGAKRVRRGARPGADRPTQPPDRRAAPHAACRTQSQSARRKREVRWRAGEGRARGGHRKPRAFTTASTRTEKVGSAIAASTIVVLPVVAAAVTTERLARVRTAGAALAWAATGLDSMDSMVRE